MPRRAVLMPVVLLLAPAVLRADAFDQYANPDLAKAIESGAVSEVKELTPKQLVENSQVLPGASAAFVIAVTNEHRYAKLLVQTARQKFGDQQVPIVLIERFVTFREGTERAFVAAGKNVQLYDGFHFRLDLGQVVPASVGGDLTAVGDGKSLRLVPAGKAKLYLATKAPPATVTKSARPVIGATFEKRYFNGSYKLADDGRRSGTLTLTVADDGEVSGSFTTDADGQKYDVSGKVGPQRHAIQFTIKFPRVEETFQGHLFTGDGRALAGTARMQDRETAFYAVRIED
jgi:hypothetical protein